jgi:tetratricopeptide (TPR) repeat protein
LGVLFFFLPYVVIYDNHTNNAVDVTLHFEMSTDWFRNTTWNETVERNFNEKLHRARRKEQYLRIQASTLARSHPEVALKLLEQYFLMSDDFDHAQAHVDRAKALLALGRISESIASYKAALAREVEFPNLQTQAYLDLPYLIATRGIQERYAYAMQLLAEHKARLMFPIDHFRWHSAWALIAAAGQDTLAAKQHAQRALYAASLEHSGFRYHPTIGVVTEQYDDLIQKLEGYSAP